MPISVAPEVVAAPHGVIRRLLLIWQNPKTRLFVRVGQLDVRAGEEFTFRYLPAAQTEPGFAPLVQFPDLAAEYSSPALPAFFANRVMSRQRDSYRDYARNLGLDDLTATPVEVLMRSGGGRVTDTFHIADDLRSSHDGVVESRFLASGVRHIEGATDRIASLQPGQELQLRDEPTNPVNMGAMLIDVSDGSPVGYVPDWLVDDVHALRASADDIKLFVEHVNPKARPHLQLLCRLRARVAPAID